MVKFIKYIIYVLFILLLTGSNVFSKRQIPEPAEPIRYLGIEYRAPHSKMGYVEAWDINTGKMIWDKRIYKVWFLFWLEGDIQTIYINNLMIEDGYLIITNERDRVYVLNLKTNKVHRKWHGHNQTINPTGR